MSKINIVVRLQHWMDSVPGQTFLNYAYSWGASIVILGALFKLTHLPGGNIMLFMGMGTETIVFFLSAFDRPFDKEEIGKELPADYETDEEIAAKLGLNDEDEEEEEETTEEKTPAAAAAATASSTAPQVGPTANGGAAHGGGTVIIGAGVPLATGGAVSVAAGTGSAAASSSQPATTSAAEAAQAAIHVATPEGAQPFENEAQRLAEIIRLANDELLRRAQAALSPEMEQATEEYIEKLRVLAETFQKVDEQSARLAHDSEEMSNLNRTLTAINKTYDLHFKSISQQVGTIEQINEQTRRLAQQIEELNGVYGRMIQALTINMNMQPATQQPQPSYAQAAPQGGYAQPAYGSAAGGCVPPQPQGGYNGAPQQ